MDMQDAGITPEEVEEQAEATTAEEEEEISEDAAAETEDEGDEDEEQEEPPKKSKGVQKRIDELVKQREEEKRQREEERRRADRLEQMLHEMYSKGQQPQPEPQQQRVEYPESPPLPPDRYDYETDDQWRQAQADFQKNLALFVQGQSQQARNDLIRQAQQAKQKQTVEQFLTDTMGKGREKFEDFDQVGFIPVGMEGVFQQAENAADIAYYLGKNPQEQQRLAGLPPHIAAFEVAKLDARFAQPVKKQPTSAPPPVRPVGGKEPSTNNILDLPVDEYIKAMNKRQYGD